MRPQVSPSTIALMQPVPSWKLPLVHGRHGEAKSEPISPPELWKQSPSDAIT
ncbi:MAG: hypothetical protein ACYTCU_10045 [Planctomycetota bacterium]